VPRALRGCDYQTYFHRNIPTPASVAELANSLRADRAEVVVAVGGGAVIDAAKAAAVLSARAELDADAVSAACDERHDGRTGTIVVAVPTTAGTGAEVTPFATIWDIAAGRKLSLTGSSLVPYAAVLDPSLVQGLPLTVLAGGVLDTIAQGAEAAWSARATSRSTFLGLRAAQAAGARLDRIARTALADTDLGALQMAAYVSGQAIALANTTACHAISYPLTLRYGLPHGHACGLTFGRLLDFNQRVTASNCTDRRGAPRVRKTLRRITEALGCTQGGAALHLDRFLADVGLERLSDLDIDYPRIADDAGRYPRCHDNPVRFDGELADLLAAPSEAVVACV